MRTLPFRAVIVLVVALGGLAVPLAGCSDSPTAPKADVAQVSDSAQGVSRPPASPAATYSYVVRPYYVDEHWRDPKNPSQEHVVMWFWSSCSMSRPYPTARFYNGQQYDWLNKWMIWPSRGGGNISSNCQTYMLFADGWWWYTHKIFISKETLASRFQLAW